MERVRGGEPDERQTKGRRKPEDLLLPAVVDEITFSLSSDFPSVSLLTFISQHTYLLAASQAAPCLCFHMALVKLNMRQLLLSRDRCTREISDCDVPQYIYT